jgi:hypothetical protein
MALLTKLDNMGEMQIPLPSKGADAIKPTATAGKAISSSHVKKLFIQDIEKLCLELIHQQ